MKKFILIAICCIGLTGNTNAQKYEYGPEQPIGGGGRELRKARFGLFVAPNISWMKPTANKSDDKLYLIENPGNKMGFAWGLMMDYYLDDNYGITTGFQLTSTGGKMNAELNPNVAPPTTTNIVKTANFDYKLRYLEVPFALKLISDELSGGMRFYGQVGLCAGIIIGKKASYDVTYTDTSATGTVTKTAIGEDEKIQGLGISPVMLHMNLGAGIEYPISAKMSFTAGIYFNNGFVPDVTNPKELDLDYKGKFSDGNTRLNSIGLRIGIFF